MSQLQFHASSFPFLHSKRCFILFFFNCRTLLSKTLIKQLLEFSAAIPDNLEADSESESCRMNVTFTLIAFTCVSLGPITFTYIQRYHNKAGRIVSPSVNCSNSDSDQSNSHVGDAAGPIRLRKHNNSKVQREESKFSEKEKSNKLT